MLHTLKNGWLVSSSSTTAACNLESGKKVHTRSYNSLLAVPGSFIHPANSSVPKHILLAACRFRLPTAKKSAIIVNAAGVTQDKRAPFVREQITERCDFKDIRTRWRAAMLRDHTAFVNIAVLLSHVRQARPAL
ncbi:hypothetical protein RP20_CCG006973 [Aedes albopictus]|nr:hypothetical protein RP20_CCG006973 [Aedes albopictus]